MDYIFDNWKKVLEDFQNSVSKDLDEIHKHKTEIQQMKTDIFNRLEGGKYIRDERRIVLSAPEIVIGNVDANGNLQYAGGSVIIKGSDVTLNGVGETGSINSRAATIRQIAVDPGMDGCEAVVQPTSSIVSLAKSIVLQSNNEEGCFSRMPAGGNGISIHSDSSLDLGAARAAESRKKDIENSISSLKTQKSNLEKSAKSMKQNIDSYLSSINKALKSQESLRGTDDLARMNYMELDDVRLQLEALMPSLYHASMEFVHTVSMLAEVNRQITVLDKQKSDIKTGKDFTDNLTGATLSIMSEQIEVKTIDGEGNLRENPGAGISVNTPCMDVSMRRKDGSLIDNSYLSVQAEHVGISTVNPKVSDKSADLPATGSVSIVSKTVGISAVDSEIKDDKLQEKALTKDGVVYIRAEKMAIDATDTEGKATGSVGINAKTVELKSMDVDKEKRTDKELAKGSSMLLLSEKMFVGAKDKDTKSKSVQTVSEQVGLFADKTLEAQQGDGKAVVQLDGGNLVVGGSKTEIYGATTIQAKTEIKDELKAPKATIDNIQAKSSFKSTNISDGIAVPAPPSSAQLSAKLKAEDAPKE